MKFSRLTAPLAVASVAALALSGCAKSDRDSGATGSGSGTGGASNATLTFGAAGAPSTFDPFYGSDGETFRVSRQIFDTLVAIKPGTADPEPGLATSWSGSADGKEWTFNLRQGVKFSDGTAFNAKAVCENFERMDSQNQAGQSASEYWTTVMGGYNKSADDLYQGCTEEGTDKVVLKFARASSKIPNGLSLTSLSMQSPTALEKYKANDIKAQGDGFVQSEYAQKFPTGTGPFKFSSYDVTNKTITLVRNDDYWGPKAKVAKLVFSIIPDESQRKQSLLAGQIDGYDLPNPTDWDSLKSAGMNLEVRPAFNILYLGLNAKADPDLKDLKVRQALYYAINRDQLVKSQLPTGATVATQFMPSTVDGYNTSLQPNGYDPAKAKSLLAEAGKSSLSIDLWYPSEVSRPYMPSPIKIFNAIKADWEAVGIKVNTITKPWAGGYIDQTQAGKAPAYLMGWTGDFNNTDNFLGSFFPATGQMDVSAYPWGATLVKDLKAADSTVDASARNTAYEKINQQIMTEYLPGLPISSSPPAIVFGKNVTGVVASPLTAEDFATAVKN